MQHIIAIHAIGGAQVVRMEIKISAVLNGRHQQTHLNCRQLSSGVEHTQHLVLNTGRRRIYL